MVSQLESSYVPMTDFPIAAIPREEPVVLSNHTTEMEEVVARTNGEMDNDADREEEDADKCIDITTEEVVVKRKRGRPPKNRRSAAPKRPPPPPIIGPDGVVQKRGRGRPKKIISEVADGSLQGGIGSQAMRDEAQKRKRAPSARGRGRPRKYPRADDVKKLSKEKMAGAVDGETPKRGRGRPRKRP
ncbi:hypothetical protein CBR_g19032 [Chara braunii]|uniref:Uncharacterized protein n=1 Tax=Chara braunii TaxID=69332 RepID=A0A388KX51_CHABU|nr:hypothetical protein CBR_g19032 [Chara braunii]|eukprot:GBG74625.1 hypothetical protein CBR_g19032 [Chara braunii]